MRDSRPIEIRTDSQYVFDGFNRNMARWKRNSWTTRGKQIGNADLWQQLQELLEQRAAGSVKLAKVKGHATWQDVASGAVAHADKLGNDKADELATLGAAMHAAPLMI